MAGCFCLDGSRQIPPDIELGLSQHLRRANDGRGLIQSYKREGIYLTKWDSGAFGESAWLETSDGGVSTLVGDPIYTGTGQRIARSGQLEYLNPFLTEAKDNFAKTRGSFSLAWYEPKSGQLKLATDSLGIRPLFYTVQRGLLIFASALRILEAMPTLERRISVIGLTEQSIYGQPLGTKSPYEGISILRESEILIAVDGQVSLDRYFDWSKFDASPTNEKDAAEWLYGHFVDGVRLRAQEGEQSYAFLSGGMDSRAIVATLIGCGHSVVALNFSPDETQDQDYAVRFAEAAGQECQLFCLPRDDDPNFSILAHHAKTALEQNHQFRVERPSILWSGDGGSVGLGHVYMDEKMLKICEQNGIEEAARYFMSLHRNYLPEGILASGSRRELPEEVYRNVVNEIKRYPRPDVGRQLYLFLLINDQRRHLYKHFESIDEHGLEFLTPFFDTKFLAAIAATPVHWGLLHKLYALWFEHLPAFARDTPWQTYPGHVECPIPGPSNLGYQWAKRPDSSSKALGERLALAMALGKSVLEPLPTGVFSRGRTLIYALMAALGVRDGEHALRTIRTFQRVYTQAN
jgi:asparagine synthase (glutamine-hydrolysing)